MHGGYVSLHSLFLMADDAASGSASGSGTSGSSSSSGGASPEESARTTPDFESNLTLYEHPDYISNLEPEELAFGQLRVGSHGVYEDAFESGNGYIGQSQVAIERAEMSGGDKSSLYSDPHVSTKIHPVPTLLDAKRFETQLIDENNAVESPDFYNKVNGDNVFDEGL